jgi:hypothetical protein
MFADDEEPTVQKPSGNTNQNALIDEKNDILKQNGTSNRCVQERRSSSNSASTVHVAGRLMIMIVEPKKYYGYLLGYDVHEPEDKICFGRFPSNIDTKEITDFYQQLDNVYALNQQEIKDLKSDLDIEYEPMKNYNEIITSLIPDKKDNIIDVSSINVADATIFADGILLPGVDSAVLKLESYLYEEDWTDFKIASPLKAGGFPAYFLLKIAGQYYLEHAVGASDLAFSEFRADPKTNTITVSVNS